MLSFLELNGVKIDASNEEVAELGIAVASGSFDSDAILNWIETHKK
jgi:death-on-curing protein